MDYIYTITDFDLENFSDEELMNLKYDAMETQSGFLMKKIKNEISRRWQYD